MLLAIPDEHLFKFHGIKDAKTLWEATKTRFGGNKESKKMHKTILKHQYTNFAVSRSEDTLSMDDLYNNLKVYEAEIKGQSSSGLNSQNVAFVSSDNTSSNNEAVNTAHDVFTASSQGQAFTSTYDDDVMFSFFDNQYNSLQLDNEDLEQIDTDDLEEMDLKWQVAMLTMRVTLLKNVEHQGVRNRNGDNTGRVVPVETLANALVVTDGMGYDWSYQAEEGLTDFALMAFSSSGSSSSDTEDNNQANDKYKSGEGYHADPPLYTGNFMPPRPDMSFVGLDDSVFKSAINETVTSVHETETSASKTSKESMEKPKTVRSSAPIIEDLESDSDADCEIRPSIEQNKPSHTKINFVKSDENTRKSVIEQHTYKQAENLGKRKYVFKKGKVTGQREVRPVWNNAQRVNHQNLSNNLTHLHPRRNFIPTVVITNSGKVPVNTAKQSSPRAATSTSTARYVNTATTRPTVNVVSVVQENEENAFKSSACWIWRPTENVIDHISKDSGLYMLRRFNYGNPQYTLHDQGIFDSGCSRHMTGIKSFLIDYQEIDGGFVAFGGSPKGGNLVRGLPLKILKMTIDVLPVRKESNTKPLNRVFVPKPHNTTPYELLISRSPNIDFMKPFGCPVTILNNLDHLGKVEGQARREKASDHEYILLPFMPSHSPFSSSTQSSDDKDADEVPGKGDEGVSKGSEIDDQERSNSSTQDVNTVRTSINTVNTNISIGSLNINTVGSNDPSMSSLEEFGIFDDVYDDTEVDAEADINNLELSTVVWTLVDLPNGNRAIGTKWVFRNKKDERGIVVRNKARLVTQGYTQEEGIDYDEVFALVARIESIRLFSTYTSFMKFIVYQMDVKSAFLYGTIEEEVYVCQPPGFEDPYFPNKVYKVEKALYGLHQAHRAWYEILSTYLLENGFRRGTIDKTLFIEKYKDDILLVYVYVDDIIFGSTKKFLCDEFKQMMHKRLQMSSIGELTFFLGLQTTSTLMDPNKALIKDAEAEDVDVHLYRSMIGLLMYLTASRPDIMFVVCAYARDSPFELKAFFDSDYAGASLDRKSTTGGCQFLGKRLLSWQCKKQTIVANSTTEADIEFGVTTGYCRLNAARQDLVLLGTYGSAEFHQTVDFLISSLIHYALTQIHAKVDGKIVVISESSVRSDLHFNDEDEQVLAAVSQPQKTHTPRRTKRGRDTEIPQSNGPSKKVGDEVVYTGDDDRVVRAATIVASLKVEQESGNINKTRSTTTLNEPSPQGTGSGSRPRHHVTTLGDTDAQTRFETASKQSHDLPLLEVNTSGSGEDSMEHQDDLMDFVPLWRTKRGWDTEIPQSSGPSKKVGDEVVYTGDDDRVVRAATTVASLKAEQESGNINKTRSTTTLNEPSPQGTGSGSGPRRHVTTLRDTDAQTRFETASKLSHDPPLSEVNTSGSGEDSMEHQDDLTNFVPLWSVSKYTYF
nr:putative ribonuclease H-like domain-containing protein [Tanacetum cinerariifolium]